MQMILIFVSLIKIHKFPKTWKIQSWLIQFCNLSVGIALNVEFTANGMCAKNNTHVHMKCKQATIE